MDDDLKDLTAITAKYVGRLLDRACDLSYKELLVYAAETALMAVALCALKGGAMWAKENLLASMLAKK